MEKTIPNVIIHKPGIFKSITRRIKNKPTITIHKTPNGQVFASDGVHTLAIAAEGRALRYTNGIKVRIEDLMATYHADRIPVRPGDLVVNFGANIGELALGYYLRGCRVAAIEPDATSLNCLRLNLPRTLEILPFGLWDRDGTLTFYEKPDSADTSALNQVGRPVEVPVRRLDGLFDGERIRLLVGDAEGAEPEVLSGAAGILDRIDWISIDCGPERNGERTIDECTNILENHGFEVIIKGDHLLARNTNIKDK